VGEEAREPGRRNRGGADRAGDRMAWGSTCTPQVSRVSKPVQSAQLSLTNVRARAFAPAQTKSPLAGLARAHFGEFLRGVSVETAH
jgi:hypothetical protein